MRVVVKEDENEGLSAFLGKPVTLFCGVYIYTGKMAGLNDQSVKLENARIVYETGELNTKTWKDAQPIGYGTWYVAIQSIESFGYMKD